MTSGLTRLATGLVGTALTVLLLVGPPWLLSTFVGSPVPSSWPDLDSLRSIATVGVTDTFVITTLAVIVWIAWVQLAIAIVIETFAAIRRRPPVRLPLIPGTQPLAARLVAATLLLVTVLQPRPLAAAAPLDLAVATAPPAAIDDEQAPVQQSSARTTTPMSTQTIVVGDRDSWWSLAETHLGDGLRWREIRDLNTDRTLSDGSTIRPNTEHLQPGWPLLVPAESGRHAEPPTASTSPVDDTDPAEGAAADEWEVHQGDHFWRIAKTALEQAWDRNPTDDEIVPYWRDLIDTNRDRLAPPGDPDLIHPGQQFELPTAPADPTLEHPAGEVLENVPAPHTDAQDADTEPVHPDEPDPQAQRDTTVERPEAEVADSWHRSLSGPAVTDESPGAVDLEAAAEPDDADDDQRTGWGLPAGLAPGLAASMFLAAGAAALFHRRRRVALQQRTTGYRLPTLAPEVRDTTQRLTVAAPPDEVLEDLVALLCSVPPAIEPVLVVAHDDGSVSLVFDQAPNGDPPAPWAADPGMDGEPVRWTAKLGDHGERRSFGMPLLVTLGRLATSTLLANLGAMRELSVQGPAEQTRTRLRAFTLEVAASRTAGPVDVAVLGDDLLEGLDQVRQIDNPDEEIAAALREVDDRIILDDRVPRLIVAHDRELPVEIPDELAPLCGAITTTPSATSWRFDVHEEHGWLHLPDGTREQVTLPDVDPTLVAQALEPDDRPDVAPEGGGESREAAERVIDVSEPRNEVQRPVIEPAWCEIGLLGPFTVTKGGEVVDGLTTISRQMLAYLVTHRETSTGKLEDAVWQGQAARGGGQRVRSALGRLRRQLGEGCDGTPLIPSRKAGHDAIALDDQIGSDLDRAFRLLVAARHRDGLQQAEMLLEALRLVRGEPFEDLPVSWAMDIQQRAVVQLQEAAARAAQLLRDADRHDDAEFAIRQGLALCDPCEPLYIEWARLEHSRGRTDQIPRLWRRLKQRYADDADEIAGLAASPTADTELEFMSLM